MSTNPRKRFSWLLMIWSSVIVYLFVTAPPPLTETEDKGKKISITQAFGILEQVNDVVRSVWTREIVGAGKKAGLKFSEDWREAEVQAGPLPALFLRETARNLEKMPIQLSLYLGSDFPIRAANEFKGVQKTYFKKIRDTGKPQFFYDPGSERYTAMFPDIAIAKACIQCHNDHDDSPKNDWRLHDIMGATTWAYPKQAVTFDELLQMIVSLQQAYGEAYQRYLDKVQTFADPPVIGKRWPREGYFLPSRDMFTAVIQLQYSTPVLESLMAFAGETADPTPMLPVQSQWEIKADF